MHRHAPCPLAHLWLGLGLCSACAAPPTTTRCTDTPPAAVTNAAQARDAAEDPAARITTGAPLPADAGVPAPPGEQRWLASDPHVPFFSLRPDEDGGSRIHAHEPEDCTGWAVPGSRWHAVGRHGALVGAFVLTGGEGYDVTNCYELGFERESGELGSGLLVTGAYQAPARSLAWTPSAAERTALAGRVAEIDGLFEVPAHADPPPALAERSLAFVRADIEGEREGDSTRWIAVGGRWFGLFSLEPERADPAPRWRLRYLDAELAVHGFVPPMAYTPLAAIDADGDGDPELVVHRSDGPSWDDLLLIPGGTSYDEGPMSTGGATI
ncbi:hypothetical protein G6O69_26025 [Pseudenhygromyxa sp. WMMC2535]|uniref:hypothetical protein n=1 Tax=Pseudenhygromyxa sp. WMMC2535 TaxID=2712867 RepID=UPI001554C7A9|nr:hypothetical protein [Pseudenhygromyxa sp. WMMC2535]NVB41322.1 hypothetical protein [Pseudenhygromyxa sp. WMMC2535]